jgi:hypothetical protein
MTIRMFNEIIEELKEDIQKQLNESQENLDKKLKKTQNSKPEMNSSRISTNSKIKLRKL